MPGQRRRLGVIAAVLGLAAVVVAVANMGEGRFSLQALTAWLEGLGPRGPFYWILIVIAAMVLILPVPMIAALSGFMFGAVAGPLYSLAGMVIGCFIAFLLGRFLFAGRAGAWLEKHPRLRGLNRGLESQGWRFILSTRLLPGFPVKISNYAFGSLGYPARHFLLGNILGLAPYQIAGAYAGSLLSDLSDPGRLAALTREPLNLAVSLAGLAAALLLLFFSVRKAVRSMANQGQAPEG